MSPSTRRQVLGLGAGALCGLAGCGGLLGVSDRVETTRTLDPGAPDLDAAGFADYAARQRERHGDAGVFGVDGDPLVPVPAGSFRGAWTASVGLPAGEKPDVPAPDDSPVRVGLNGGPAARFRLPAGRLAPAVGDGAFAVEWAGTHPGRIGVAGVCETGGDAVPGWRVEVAAGRGTL